MIRWAATALLALILAAGSSYAADPDPVVETGPTRIFETDLSTGNVVTSADSLPNWTTVLSCIIDASASAVDVEVRLFPKAGGMTGITVEAGLALTLPLQFEKLVTIASAGDTVVASASGSFRVYLLGD